MKKINELKEKLDKARIALSDAENELHSKKEAYRAAKSCLDEFAQKQADVEDFKKYNGKYWKITPRKGGAEIGWYFHVDKFVPWCKMDENEGSDTLRRNEVLCKKVLHYNPVYEVDGGLKKGIEFNLTTICRVKWCNGDKVLSEEYPFDIKRIEPSSKEEFEEALRGLVKSALEQQ